MENNRNDVNEEYRSAVKNSLEKIAEIESRIREKIVGLSDSELSNIYKQIIVGARFYIGSFGGVSRLRGAQGNDSQLMHRAAYANALATYDFTKNLILQGNQTTLKVKRDSGHSEQVPIENIFFDAVRRITIFEEYARRS